MSTIKVPVINELPNTITVTFQQDYAVPFEVANPDGVPGNCEPGGPGQLGGPDYVNMLQRTTSKTGQNGYRYEVFQLSSYPNHTFYSFSNYTTGVKNVVAFLTNPSTTATIPDATFVTGVITAAASASVNATGLTASVTAVPNAVTYAWTGTAIGAITSGSNTHAIVYTAAATTGAKTLICTVTDEIGHVVASSTFTVTLS